MLNNDIFIHDECVYDKKYSSTDIIELDLTNELTYENKEILNKILPEYIKYDFIYFTEFIKFKDVKHSFLFTIFNNIFANFKYLLKEDGIIIAKFNDDDFDNDFHFVSKLSEEKLKNFLEAKEELKKIYIRDILSKILNENFKNELELIKIEENNKYIHNSRDINNYYIFKNITNKSNETKKRKMGGNKKLFIGPRGGKYYLNNKTNKKIYIK